MNPIKKIIFVYNAESGKLNALIDSLHKIVSPSTYNCNLCAITHTPFGMKKQWARFIEETHLPVEFLHRDEFQKQHQTIDTPLPAIFINTNQRFEKFISSDEINHCSNLTELEKLIKTKISQKII